MVIFAINAPSAPAGAEEMVPTYARDHGPDPIRLSHVDWHLRTGDTARQAFARPALTFSPEGPDEYLATLKATSLAATDVDTVPVDGVVVERDVPSVDCGE